MTSRPTKPVDNVVITTKGLQDRNINILDGRTVENKGKLILNKISTWKILRKNGFDPLPKVRVYRDFSNLPSLGTLT